MKYVGLILFCIAIGFAMSLSSRPVETKVRHHTKKVKAKGDVWVMVIDTGIAKHDLLKGSVQYDESDDYIDAHGHGTHVAGILLYGNEMGSGKKDRLCDQVKIFSCRYYIDEKHTDGTLERSNDCVTRATKLKMDYINFSGGGGDFSAEEYTVYKKFIDGGGKVFVAAGNSKPGEESGKSLTEVNYYPASYGLKTINVPINLTIVENVHQDGTLVKSSNWSDQAVKAVGYNIVSTAPGRGFATMTGTSQATPAYLHTVLRQYCDSIVNKKK